MLRLWQAIKQYKDGHQPLYHLSLVILFWSIADGIVSFALPIYLKQVLKDLFLVGLIFASSSFFGLLADIVFGSEQKNRTFRSYFVTSVILAIVAYLLTLKAYSWLSFLLVMALWGVYYESFNFCLVDFLSRFSKKWEHAQASGVVNMFFSLGYLLAPLIAGFVVLRGRIAMIDALFFITLSAFAFLFWFAGQGLKPEPPVKKLNFKEELKLWFKVGKKSFWVLNTSFLLYLWESLIWGMGPILLLSTLGAKGSFVMVCFSVPRVFFQGYAGYWADKKGKKSFLILGLIITGVFLALFSLSNNLIFKSLMALVSALGASLVYPAADGLFIDMIDGYKEEEEEIAGVKGVAFNLGYIIGPIIAGFLGRALGLSLTFIIFGIFLVFGAILMKVFWR